MKPARALLIASMLLLVGCQGGASSSDNGVDKPGRQKPTAAPVQQSADKTSAEPEIDLAFFQDPGLAMLTDDDVKQQWEQLQERFLPGLAWPIKPNIIGQLDPMSLALAWAYLSDPALRGTRYRVRLYWNPQHSQVQDARFLPYHVEVLRIDLADRAVHMRWRFALHNSGISPFRKAAVGAVDGRKAICLGIPCLSAAAGNIGQSPLVAAAGQYGRAHDDEDARTLSPLTLADENQERGSAEDPPAALILAGWKTERALLGRYGVWQADEILQNWRQQPIAEMVADYPLPGNEPRVEALICLLGKDPARPLRCVQHRESFGQRR